MDINNKARIHWACRRGMRELDISIMPFFEYEYDSLNDADKALFIRLLECDDRFVQLADESWRAAGQRAAENGDPDPNAK